MKPRNTPPKFSMEPEITQKQKGKTSFIHLHDFGIQPLVIRGVYGNCVAFRWPVDPKSLSLKTLAASEVNPNTIYTLHN